MNKKLVIIHADDFGMSRSINEAIISAWELGAISSASIMAPCPGFEQAANYARTHPSMDIGVHVTLTSEWKRFRWGPVGQPASTRSLVEGSGYLRPDARSFVSCAQPVEVEFEIRAQVRKIIKSGIKPSHLDCHMGVIATEQLVACCSRVAREYSLLWNVRDIGRLTTATFAPLLNGIFQATKTIAPENWYEYYGGIISSLSPGGAYEVIVHPGINDLELQNITQGHTDWGAEWRQRDFDVITGDPFRQQLKDCNIAPITWGELKLISRQR
jgi:predicted glycoside hydrolase/deacetylase ChbG (UPF0249 family)